MEALTAALNGDEDKLTALLAPKLARVEAMRLDVDAARKAYEAAVAEAKGLGEGNLGSIEEALHAHARAMQKAKEVKDRRRGTVSLHA